MTSPRALAAAAAAALIAFAIGVPCLDGGFVRDDLLYVATNPHVMDDEANFLDLFAAPFAAHSDVPLGLWRPLATASWRVDRILGGAADRTRAFHLQNLFWNAVAAATLCLLLAALGVNAAVAGAAAALFAVHPARSEAVFWISGRSELLMTAFSLLALLAASKAPRSLKGPLTALLACAAFASKEQGAAVVVLAALIPGLDGAARRSLVVWTGAALFAAFVFRGYVLGALGPSIPGTQVLPGVDGVVERLPYGLWFLGSYARLLAWPAPLLNEYDDPDLPLSVVRTAIGVAVGCAVLVALLRTRRAPRLAFAAALFAAPLAPTLNVVYRTGETFAERFLCLPAAGVAVAVALLAAREAKLGALVVATLALLCAAGSADRAKDWRSQRALAEAGVADAPENGGSWLMAASDRLDEFGLFTPTDADYAYAGKMMTEATRRDPSRAQALVNLARKRLSDYERNPATDGGRAALADATTYAATALEAAPDNGEARVVGARALVFGGDVAGAEALLRKELASRPRSFAATVDLSDLLDRAGRKDEAAAIRARALERAEDDAAKGSIDVATYRAIAFLRLSLGRAADAEVALRFARDLARGPAQRAELAVQLSQLAGGGGNVVGATRELKTEADRFDARAAEETDADLRRPYLVASAIVREAMGDRAGARAKLLEAAESARGRERARLAARLQGL